MASTEALFDHRAGCVQEVPDAATRCRSVHTVAIGSGGLSCISSTPEFIEISLHQAGFLTASVVSCFE